MSRTAGASTWSDSWRALKTATASFVTDDVLTLAASLSFYTLLSFAPILALAIWLASLAGIDAQESLLSQIAMIAGTQARDAAQAVIASGKAHPDFGSIAGALGILTLLVGATAVFAQLQSSLNAIFQVVLKPTNAAWDWLRRRILSAGVLLASGFVLIVSLLVNALLDWGLGNAGIEIDVLNEAITVAIFAALFGMLFRYLPDARIPWRSALAGGLMTAVLFVFGKWLIGIYISRGDVGGAYGAAGSFVVLLVWSYYSAAIFFFGAELTKAWLDVRRIAIRPARHAELTSAQAARS